MLLQHQFFLVRDKCRAAHLTHFWASTVVGSSALHSSQIRRHSSSCSMIYNLAPAAGRHSSISPYEIAPQYLIHAEVQVKMLKCICAASIAPAWSRSIKLNCNVYTSQAKQTPVYDELMLRHCLSTAFIQLQGLQMEAHWHEQILATCGKCFLKTDASWARIAPWRMTFASRATSTLLPWMPVLPILTAAMASVVGFLDLTPAARALAIASSSEAATSSKLVSPALCSSFAFAAVSVSTCIANRLHTAKQVLKTSETLPLRLLQPTVCAFCWGESIETCLCVPK